MKNTNEEETFADETPQPTTVCSYEDVHVKLVAKGGSIKEVRLPAMAIFDRDGALYCFASPPQGGRYKEEGLVEIWSEKTGLPVNWSKLRGDVGCYLNNVLGVPTKAVIGIRAGSIDVVVDAIEKINKYTGKSPKIN